MICLSWTLRISDVIVIKRQCEGIFEGRQTVLNEPLGIILFLSVYVACN